MALKKNRRDEEVISNTEYTAEVEQERDENGKLIDKNTGKAFPEAPKSRQGDGVATGEVPAGFYK